MRKIKKGGAQRIKLDEIGFNRSGLGISGHHVHEVFEDCVKNVHTVKNAHTDVLVLRPPLAGYPPSPEELMPTMSEHIKYACVLA